jgi:hypothetical protein
MTASGELIDPERRHLLGIAMLAVLLMMPAGTRADSGPGKDGNDGRDGKGNDGGDKDRDDDRDDKDKGDDGRKDEDDDGTGRDRRSEDREVTLPDGTSVEIDADGAVVRYSDGWKEIISEGRYSLRDQLDRTVIERPATDADLVRISKLAGP